MGTRFRTLLAPVGTSTGDGRRFADEAISVAGLPMPLEWVRERQGGHDGAVSIGAVDETFIGSVAEALAGGFIGAEQVAGMDPTQLGIWARGELYDDVDRETMPRLAEDVATAMHLITNGTLGPSVDLDTFDGVPVLAGTNEPLTEELYAAHFAATGEEPKVELLVTSGRVRAATAVSIPAFAETSRPFELLPLAEGAESRTPALIASVGVVEQRHALKDFSRKLAGPTPITYDFDTGQVYGHVATWRTCHTGYTDVCVTAPRDNGDPQYAAFNRFPIETADGIVWAGRLTAGGRHAALSATAAGAIAEHDAKNVVAYVRAYEDEFGIAVAGVLSPDLDEGTKAILSRRKVSGDWRETSAGLSLVEVLALSPGPVAHSEPGFPVETFSRAGRQVALVASLGPEVANPWIEPRAAAAAVHSVAELAAAIVDEQARRERRNEAASSLAVQTKADVDRRRSALAQMMEA